MGVKPLTRVEEVNLWRVRGLAVFGLGIALYAVQGAPGRAPSALQPVEQFARQNPGALVFATSYLFLLNYRLFGSVLQRTLRGQRAVAKWLRVGRIALAAIPLLGPYLLSLGRWTVGKSPFWSLATRGQRQTPPLYFLDARLFYTFQCNLLVFQGWIAYLGVAPGRHLLSPFLCALAFGVSQLDVLVSCHRALISRRRALFLALLSSVWLLSWPFWVWGWMGHILLINTAPRPKNRMRAFFKGRLGLAERLEDSLRLDWWRASRWRLWRPSAGASDPAVERRDEEKLVPLYRFKTFLTVFEAMGVAILLVNASRRSAVVASSAPFALFIIVVSSLTIAALGFLVLACGFLARHFRRPLFSDQIHSVIKYLVLSQTGLLVGIYCGLYFAAGDLRRLGVLLTVASGIACLTTFLLSFSPLLPSRESVEKTNDFRLFFWMGIFVLGAAAGVAIRASETLLYCFKLLILLFMALTPIFALGIGLNLASRFRPLVPPRSAPALWGAFIFCLITAVLPLGGLAVPVWILTRRRVLAALSSSPLLVHRESFSPGERGENGPLLRGLTTRSSTKESRDYFFANVVSHLATGGSWPKTCELFERTHFLAEQLEHFGGYGKSSSDVEACLIPMAIEERDWSRFVHFMMLALHLRGTAEDLPDLVEQLAQSGRMSMALDALSRIANPLDRAGAKARVASKLPPDSDVYQNLLESLPHDFASLPPLSADPAMAEAIAEKQFWVMVVIAQVFGLAAREPLTLFLRDRPVWWSDMIWINMVSHHAEQHGLLNPEVWQALGNVQEPARHKDYLPDFLALAEDLSDAESLLSNVEGLSDDPELSWLCRFALLNRIAGTSMEQAISLWRCWTHERPISWTPRIAEQSAPFLQRLDSQEITSLVGGMNGPEPRAALLLALCSLEGGLQRIEETKKAIEKAPLAASRFHGSTHFLKLRSPHLSRSEIQSEVERIAGNLQEMHDEIPAADLRCLFEVVAEYLPEKLEGELMRALWSAKITVECFIEIVETTESAALLRHLLEKMDQYLLPFRPGEAEAFQAWSMLLQKIVPRLSVLTKDLGHLERAVELSPEQADELRTTTVKALVEAESPDLAEQVCHSIVSPRLKRLTRLKLLTGRDSNALHPVSLLESFVGSEMIQDEVSGLQALASTCGSGCHFLQGQVDGVEDREERFLVLLRMIDRALASSEKRERQTDLLDSLVQSAGLVTADVQLAGLTPEVTAVVARHSERQAISETREALEHLLSLRSVLWPTRRELCEALLSRLLPLIANHAEKGRYEASEAARMILEPLQWIDYGSDQEIEERGIVPVLFAVMDRLPLRALRRFLKELPSEGFFPVLYVADDGELGRILDRMVEEDSFQPLIVETVLYLLSYRVPNMVPEILRDLTYGPYRDTIASSLLRHGWLPAALAPEILLLIENPVTRMSTEITLGLGCRAGSGEEESWLQTLASILSHQLVDPSDPRNEPWLRKLWSIDPERSRPILARGCLRALAQAGRWQGMSAFGVWLHAHLAPDAMRDPVAAATLCTEAEQAVQKALTPPALPASTNP